MVAVLSPTRSWAVLKRNRLQVSIIFLIAAVVIIGRFQRSDIFIADCESLRQSIIQDVAELQHGQNQSFSFSRQLFHCYLALHMKQIEEAWARQISLLEPRGVVTSAGSGYFLANAFVNLYALRHFHGSTLPFTIMQVKHYYIHICIPTP